MNLVLTLLLVVQSLSALGMVGLILMQHGKGADAGAAFGGGGSASLFGASGSANFLSRSTAVLATLFLACTLALAYFGNPRGVIGSGSSSVLETAPVPVETNDSGASEVPAPAADTTAAPATTAPDAAQVPAQ